MKALIYARASAEEAATNSQAIQKQIATCYEYASRNGYEVEGVFKEVASGGNDDRIELLNLINHVTDSKGVISAVLVSSFDRLTRNIINFVHVNDMFQGLGIEVITATPSETDAASRLLKNMLMAFAKFEKEVRSERIRQGIRRKRNLQK